MYFGFKFLLGTKNGASFNPKMRFPVMFRSLSATPCGANDFRVPIFQ
jgi:hypothetical protein